MIELVQRWEPLGKNGIQGNDPSDERLVELIVSITCFFLKFDIGIVRGLRRESTYNSQGEAFFIKIGIVCQISSQAKDDYRNKNLKDTGDKHPEGCDQDMGLFAFRLLHGEVECLNSNQLLFLFC